MARRKYFTEDRLKSISELAIPLPILFAHDGNNSKVIEALYVTDISTNLNYLRMPEYIEMERMTADGIITAGTYQLVDSFMAHETKFDENNN